MTTNIYGILIDNVQLAQVLDKIRKNNDSLQMEAVVARDIAIDFSGYCGQPRRRRGGRGP